MPAIEVRDLHKRYGDNHAVRGVSFDVRPGEVYALLGPNGAGKSSVVEILEGHRTPSAGSVSVLGFDPADAERDFRDRIGVVLQSSGVENEFTVREVLDLYGSAYRTRRPLEEVLRLTGLEAKADDRVGSLSGGQRRRVDLALGIVGTPDVLFLDEPTTGFDPSARRLSWDLIEQLGAGGTTVLLTTHYLDEAEHLADRVGVIADGVLIAEDTPSALIEGISGTVVRFQLPESVEPADAVPTFAALIDAPLRVSGRLVEATVEHSTRVVHRLTGWAVDHDLELLGLSVTRASLEDVYLQLTSENGTAPTRRVEAAGDSGSDVDVEA